MNLKKEFMLLFAFFFVLNFYAQAKDETITLSFSDIPLSEAVKKIENATKYTFFYDAHSIDLNQRVSLSARKVNIHQAVSQMLFKTNVDFEINNRQIALFKKKSKDLPLKGTSSRKISGVVYDNNGESIIGASVKVIGANKGTMTNMDGRFSLDIPEDGQIVISCIGYYPKTVSVSKNEDLKIYLSEDVKTLNDVVVVGYGTMNKRELTSSISTIKSKDLLQGAFNSPLQMIDGKVAGVTISNPAAADPNRSTDIQVRGASSISAGNGPLVIIDGIPGGDIHNVAQQDIESMTVLKDGSAAAIYGSRAANGVIIIETKKGKSGKGTINYDSFFDHDIVAAKPEILSAKEFISDKRGGDYGSHTDWYDSLIRNNNFGQNHFISFSGGNDNTVLRVSANYRDKSGIDIASERKEKSVRGNFMQKALDGFLEFNGNISYKDVKEEYTNYSDFQEAIKLNPTMPIYDSDDATGFYSMSGTDFNPVQDLKTRENGGDQTYSIVDFGIKLNLLHNLNTEAKFSQQDHDQYLRQYYSSKAKESVDNNRNGRARLQDEKWTDYTFEWIGNYFTTIDKSDIKLMSGYSYQESNDHGFWAENMNFPSDALSYNNLGAGSWQLESGRLGMNSWKSKEKTIAFFGRTNYSYDDMIFLTGSLRYEGNTKFGYNNKWGFFPAASAAWRLSKLNAISDVSFINDLKLRFSYGVTGRSGFDRYSALARYTGFGYAQDDEGKWIQVYGPANNPNPDLRWEKQISYNLGLDYSLFDNRLSGSLDLFTRKGKDVLSTYDASVPPYLWDQIFTNVASTKAKGIELLTTFEVVKSRNFSYTTNIVASYTKSLLDKFSNGIYTKGYMDRYFLPAPGNPGYVQRLQDNTEIGSYYGYKYAGVDNDGKILIWKKGIVGSEKVLATEGQDVDKTFLGHGSPRVELTWGNDMTYKNFDLSLYFRGRFDYKILNTYQMYYGLVAESGINLLKDAYTRNGNITSGKVMCDYFLENGDYLKLDNVTLGWTPKLKLKHIQNLRVYGTVKNVFTVTKFTGLDPTTVNIAGLEPGILDLAVYPITRNFTLGIQITL